MHLILWALALLIQNPWQIQADQVAVDFKIKNAGLNVEGHFGDFRGNIVFDPAAPENGQIFASVGTSTIDTGIGMRDRHLKKDDYFHAEKYPRLTFTSTAIRKSDDGYIAVGTLDIKGTQKEVEVPFTFENNVFQGELSLNRRDYGVGGKSLTLSNSVFISIRIPVTSAAP
ncbi:MAG: YceI family protein [Bacteroidota bacterium]